MRSAHVTLYAVPASHPCAAVEAALRLKRIGYRRVELLPLTQLLVGPLRYGAATVPGMRVDGERVAGSRAIMRRLDRLAAQPPLLPRPGESAFARVLEAERWGDETLQDVPRRILDVAFLRAPSAMESYAGDARLVLPRALLRPALPMTARLLALRNGAREERVRTDLGTLGAQLDRVDRWIDEGLLGGELPNAADLQIGSSVRLLLSIADLRPLIEPRPAARLTGYFPPMSGEIPAGTLPAEWLRR